MSLSRPAVRYIYHPERNQIYELCYRNGTLIVVSRVRRHEAGVQPAAPVKLWHHLRGAQTPLVRALAKLCEANTAGDSYDDAAAAYARQRAAFGYE